ncbi:hypothetical protein TNCV_920471 [Trichonephila clavipes]|nr:hypothetical protein TNCV_920471 [Trichonephila clavipes]
MCLQAYESKPGHQRSSSLYQQHPHLQNHHDPQQTSLQHQHIYRLNRHSEPNSRFAHDYLSDGNSDEEDGSSNGDKACFQGGGNTTDSHEMSEAECDRDYQQHLRKSKAGFN